MRTICLLCLLPIPAFSQLPENQVTQGIINGRFWNTAPENAKVYVVVGYCTGMAASEGTNPLHDDCTKATYGEIREGLDTFYREPLNRAIPLPLAVHYFALKMLGTDPEAVEKLIVSARQFSVSK